MGCIDTVDVRPCPHCGRDALHIRDGLMRWRLEPFAVRGRDLSHGWHWHNGSWRVHVASVAPADRYAFAPHTCRHLDNGRDARERDTALSNPIDPFDVPDKRPSLSFAGAPIGTTFACVVAAAPKLVQSRDFDTGQPATWPDGNPKMTAVIDVTVDGEDRSVWAAQPSALFTAIAAAQRVAGQSIAVGGTLTIRYSGDKPNSNPRLNAQKLYDARYSPPDAFAAAVAPQGNTAQVPW